MSAKVCPNKAAPEWKFLVEKLGEDGAMRMFMLYEDNPDALKIAAERLDINRYTIEEKIDRLMSVSSRVGFDNSPDPKTGEPRHDYFIEDNTAPDGRKRLQSVSEILDLDENTRYRGDDAGNEYSRRGSELHTPFDKLAKGVSEPNIRSFMQEKGIPVQYYAEVASIFQQLSSRGKVLTEVLVSDLQSSAGSADIVLLTYEGTVELYDIKTAHQTRRFQLNPKDKIWDPTSHFGGYKARRYPSQVEFYAKHIENILGQPVSKKFIIPIEIKYKNYDPSQGYESITVLPIEDVDTYGYKSKARRIVDTFFGDYTPEPRPALLSKDDSGTFLSSITGRMENRVTDMDEEAENVMLTRTRTMRGLLHYRDDQGWKLFRNQTDRALQKRQVIDEFLSKKESAKRDIVESIKNYLKTGEDPAFLSNSGIVQQNLRLILSKYQGPDRDVQVYELSDIKGFENKTNWVVFQEGQNYDILYIGNDSLNSRLSLDKSQGIIRTLFRNFYTGEQARNLLGSPLMDTVLDAKRFESALIAMKLKESNPDARFDRITIYSLNEITGDLPPATNLSLLLPIVKKLVRGGRIPNLPASYANIFADDKYFDYQNYGQDFVKTYSDYMTMMNKTQSTRVYKGIKDYEQGHLDKKNLMDMITSEITALRATGKQSEYAHQLYLLSNMYYQLREIPTDVRPISVFERIISMPSNVANRVIQDLYVQVKGAINRIREAFWSGYKKDFIEVQKTLFKEAGFTDVLQDITISNTSKYYEPLFKKVDKNIREDDGQVRTEKVNTFEFIEEGSSEFNALTKAQQTYIIKANDAIMEAASIAGIEWVRGRIPLVQATFMNRFYRASTGNTPLSAEQAYKDSLTSLLESMEDNFGLGSSKKKNEHDIFLKNLFNHQANSATSEGKRGEMLGFTQDGYVKPELHAQFETNMEVVIDLFMMNAIRVNQFNKVASVFNTAKTLFEMQKSNFFDEELSRNINWVEVWEQAMLNNRDVDSGTLPNKVVRGVNKVASAFLIGFKPATAIVAYLGQELTSLSQSVANSLSGADSFKFTHWVKAGAIIYNPRNKEKVDLLLEQYGLFDLDLNALVNGRRRYGNRSIFKSKFLYGMLNAGDWASRSRILVAQMLSDGTWDAHSVVDGELVYDETKDERFKTEEGKLIQRAIKQTLASEGHLTGRSEDPIDIRRMTRAYDDRLANKLKFEADQIVGGFDRETRGLYNYTALGKLLGLFKTWLPARLNRGFDRSFESMVNGNYIIETDSNGQKQVVWRGKQMEGIMHSLLAGISWLRHIKDRQNQVPLTQHQRENLYRLMSDTLMMGFVMLVFMGLPDDDDETKLDDSTANMLRKSIQDLLSVYNVFQTLELLYTPVAVEFTQQTAEQIWDIFAGIPDPEQRTSLDILRTGPVSRHFTWLIEEMEQE